MDIGKTMMRTISAYAPQTSCTAGEESSFNEPRTDPQCIKRWKLKEQEDNAFPALLSCLTPSAEGTVEEQ
ncbi:hypothetical protein ANCDUO_03135 [Ancylostoma duodenale]|uniref:Uncharacterized protein n=1 Tax=Ancylostoma duodenale TaxID=51022 RepID=A0A0C2DUN4_9BILA|nr:hypothetical protein ANCDUO_03135 [Ancylostoma duodenale]